MIHKMFSFFFACLKSEKFLHSCGASFVCCFFSFVCFDWGFFVLFLINLEESLANKMGGKESIPKTFSDLIY